MPLLVTRKGPLSRAFSSSGRRDLNSGPLVPQTDLAVWRQVPASGVKWPISREILAAQWTFAASLRDPVLRRLGPYWAPPRLAGLVLVPGLSVFVSQTFGERNLRADRTYPVGAVGGRRRLPRLPVVGPGEARYCHFQPPYSVRGCSIRFLRSSVGECQDNRHQ